MHRGPHPAGRVRPFDHLNAAEIDALASHHEIAFAQAAHLAIRTRELHASAVRGLLRETRYTTRPGVFVCLACGAYAIRELDSSWLVFDAATASGLREYEVLVVLSHLAEAWGEAGNELLQQLPPGSYAELAEMIRGGSDDHALRRASRAMVRAGAGSTARFPRVSGLEPAER